MEMNNAGASSSDNLDWNIPKNPNDSIRFPQEQHNPVNQIFSLRSFSAAGGGDAPLITEIPRMRSQLFTISTRSVMASHSQLNVSYTTTSAQANVGDVNFVTPPLLSPSGLMADIDNDYEGNMEVKAINTSENVFDACKISNSSYNSSVEKRITETKSGLLGKRCIHGSIEDLSISKFGVQENWRKEMESRRKSAPGNYGRGQMIEAANELLVEENKHLTNTIQTIKRRLLMAKIAAYFTMEALKRRGKAIKKLETVKLEKEQQCAARLILHSLLVNCWRNTKRELDIRLDDNAELKKSVENFSLQVQVLRHVQNNEKQKSQEKSNLIETLNDELRILKEENRIMRKEIERMENELNSLQASTQNLTDENKVLSREIASMVEKKDRLSEALERERSKAERLGKENSSMKDTVKTIENHLRESTEQKAHWQERARCFESEAWQLQQHMETRDQNIKELTAACEAFRAERMKLIDLKSELKLTLDQTTVSLNHLSEKNEELNQSFEIVKQDRDSKGDKLHELEKSLDETKKEFHEVERELLSFKLKNVRRRREWGNALYFIVSPVDAVRRSFS